MYTISLLDFQRFITQIIRHLPHKGIPRIIHTDEISSTRYSVYQSLVVNFHLHYSSSSGVMNAFEMASSISGISVRSYSGSVRRSIFSSPRITVKKGITSFIMMGIACGKYCLNLRVTCLTRTA